MISPYLTSQQSIWYYSRLAIYLLWEISSPQRYGGNLQRYIQMLLVSCLNSVYPDDRSWSNYGKSSPHMHNYLILAEHKKWTKFPGKLKGLPLLRVGANGGMSYILPWDYKRPNHLNLRNMSVKHAKCNPSNQETLWI